MRARHRIRLTARGELRGARRSRYPAPRWGVLVLVLLGVLLMHGGPAAAGGCHGSMTTAMGTSVPAGDSTAGHQHNVQIAAVRAAAGMDGAVCVATVARAGVALPVPAAVAVLTPVAAPLSPPVWAAGDGCRGPPTGGRDLLLRVCISRT